MLLKAKERGIVSYNLINLREFGKGVRKRVDDTPYGGGDGMLLMVDPLVKAIEHAKALDPNANVILPSPRGKTYSQAQANTLAESNKGLIIICPHYEGYDERVTNWVDAAYCIGEYVLTGGELPALVIVDSVVRLLPGVLGGASSAAIESFQAGNEVEFPQYTRPKAYRGLKVPSVLLSGHHQAIEDWRKKQQHKSPFTS
ncbi:tRNA (guanosine(37)-N1)-methyltransferase TrmD, partial [Patescibacteria group bacterium]|nr:tRNA (guanosine(37)-N1)-methyltransferase TrmD [Patescibacteria group bacterium]